jgi:hypothetical protein
MPSAFLTPTMARLLSAMPSHPDFVEKHRYRQCLQRYQPVLQSSRIEENTSSET